MFASIGEQTKDFEVFHPDRMASRILDMGDVLTLIEQAERAFDKRQTDEMARKFLADEDFTFDDFLEQMSAIKKMGSLKQMLGMMPGMAQMRDQIDSLDEREFDRVEAMVRSMTPYRAQPPQADQRLPPGAHRRRLGRHRDRGQPAARAVRRGAEDDEASSRGGGGGIPGMPGLPGGPAGSKKQQRKKGKSGNPAKRAEQEKELAARQLEARENAAKNAFGAPGTALGAGPGADGNGTPGAGFDPSSFDPSQLPKGFDKFLKG
jgi:signal recognition particle subunit SRP54